jgi:hypothetical protein
MGPLSNIKKLEETRPMKCCIHAYNRDGRTMAVAIAVATLLGGGTVSREALADEAANPAIQAGPVAVTFGGFTELATLYRDRNETADVGSNFNTAIPFPNSNNEALSEFRMSARQSRLSMLAQGPQDADVVAEGYFEMDFLGAAPTAN